MDPTFQQVKVHLDEISYKSLYKLALKNIDSKNEEINSLRTKVKIQDYCIAILIIALIISILLNTRI